MSIKAACEKACDVVQPSWRGRQRPWLNQRAGEIFSNIRIIRRSPPRSPIPATEDLEVECLPRWVQLLMARILGFTVALVVLILFFSLFFCFKISGAEQVARGNDLATPVSALTVTTETSTAMTATSKTLPNSTASCGTGDLFGIDAASPGKCT